MVAKKKSTVKNISKRMMITAKKGNEICDGDYAGDESLVDIEIASTVTAIGELIAFFNTGAFQGCPNLKSVVIPSSVAVIGAGTFAECEALESVTMPNVSKGCNLNGSTTEALGIFRGCGKLARVDVVGENGGLSSEDGVVYTVDKLALLYCPAGRRTLRVPEGVRKIENYAFKGSNIEEVVLPASIVNIGDCAFANCKKLKKITFKGDKLECLALTAFDDCESLEELTLPPYIDDYLYSGDDDPLCSGCLSLKKVALPANQKEWKKKLPKGVAIYCEGKLINASASKKTAAKKAKCGYAH